MDINVSKAVSNNRKKLSIIGSTLGTQFHQVDVRPYILDFNKKSKEIEEGGNAKLFFNRSMMRYRILSKDIVNIGTDTDIAGQPIVYINRNADGVSDVEIPYSESMDGFAKVSNDALRDAINGDKHRVFASIEKLAAQMNARNSMEIKNIDDAIDILKKARQSCVDAINENNEKVSRYEKEFGETAAVDVVDESGVKVNVVVEAD